MNTITINGAQALEDLKGKKLLIYPSFDPQFIKGLDLVYFEKHRQKFLDLIGLIYERQGTDKRYKNLSDYVKLPSQAITAITNTRQRSAILNELERSGLIEIDHSYSAGNYCKGYRLGKPLRKSKNLDVLLIDSASKSNKSKPEIESSQITKYLQNHLNRLELSTESLEYCISKYNTSISNHPIPYVFTSTNEDIQPNYVYIEKRPYDIDKALSDISSIIRILSGNYRELKRDNTTYRVHSFLTNLRSDLRGFLKVKDNNESLFSIDLANSQIFFFNNVIKETYPDFHDHKELIEFINHTSTGNFYEFGSKMSGISDRDKFKMGFISSYLFSKNKFMDEKYVKFMEEFFPKVHSLIFKLKQNNNKELPRKLQKLESKYFIDRIVPRLMVELNEKDFVGTIHDSIITNQSAVEKVSAIIKDEFLKDGLTPTLKVKEIKKIKHAERDCPRLSPPPQTLSIEYRGMYSEAKETEMKSSNGNIHILTSSKKAPLSFKKAGWHFTQLKRHNNIALYEGYKHVMPIRKSPDLYKLSDGSYGIFTYEIHSIRTKKAGKYSPNWDTTEYLANDEEFGRYAWRKYSYEAALERYSDKLKVLDCANTSM